MGSVGQMGAYAPVFKKEGKKKHPRRGLCVYKVFTMLKLASGMSSAVGPSLTKPLFS